MVTSETFAASTKPVRSRCRMTRTLERPMNHPSAKPSAKRFARHLALLLASGAACGAAVAGTSVGVSIGINQPGVYGRVDIGNIPLPVVVYPQPVVISPAPVYFERRPIHLYVPHDHSRNWGRYCGRYAACGQPVYFVSERWVADRYHDHYPVGHRGKHKDWDKHDDDDHGERRGKGHGHDRD